jgi:hypothetical protein
MPRKVYFEDFKKGAVDQVIGQRHSISSVANRLGLELTQPESPDPQRVRSLGRTMPRKGPLDETQETHDGRDHQETA